MLPDTMIAIDPAGAGGPQSLIPVERPAPRPQARLLRIGRFHVKARADLNLARRPVHNDGIARLRE